MLLLFHGVGASPDDMRPLGEALAAQRPAAWVISVRSPDPCDLGAGWQWFSVQGVTEANRPGRVAAAMPAFQQSVSAWQSRSGVPAARTTLIGFSQGSIMSLESTQQAGPALAQRVISIAGRFAQAPTRAPAGTVVDLMHGDVDRVMPISLAAEAHAQLQALGGHATLERFTGLGHGIDMRVVEAILKRLGES
ncbi:MAG: esterase [Rhodocyclaceae bacterium]|nr:esterase [Rhodocyclaceae bacterium]MBX3671125.1 esterase [Rhodocyclaceae bacterium]